MKRLPVARQRVLLVQLDGKGPLVALMRLAAHYRALGWEISFLWAPGRAALDRGLYDDPRPFDRVYGSLVFTWTRPLALRLLELYPHAIVGGTGWDFGRTGGRATLEGLGITTLAQDYSIYPAFTPSIGYTQRGCRLRCDFCDVWRSEPVLRAEQDVASLWRGEGHPRHLLVLDNDFTGAPGWQERAAAMRDGGFRVCLSQGINVRLVKTAKAAREIATLDYYDDSFRDRRLYCAWDNRGDEERLFHGLNLLCDEGVKPDELMVYMLCGFSGETEDDRLYRHDKLREFGARPFPMPYRGLDGETTTELRGFARWAIKAYDKSVSWSDFKRARCQVRNLRRPDLAQGQLFPTGASS